MNRIIYCLLFCLIFFVFTGTFKPYFNKFLDFNTNSGSWNENDSLLLTPKSGREVLPANVQTCLKIIDSLKAKNYFMYGSFPQNDMEFYQRIQESAWPARNDSTSKLLFGYPEELNKIAGLKIIFNQNNFCVGVR